MAIETFEFTRPAVAYVAAAAVGSLLVRVVGAVLRAAESPEHFYSTFKAALLGYGASPAANHTNDFLQTYVLGVLELCIYPVFLIIGKPEFVGAWIGLKVVPQWKFWTEHRHIYNRFLILNALVAVIAYVLAELFLRSA